MRRRLILLLAIGAAVAGALLLNRFGYPGPVDSVTSVVHDTADPAYVYAQVHDSTEGDDFWWRLTADGRMAKEANPGSDQVTAAEPRTRDCAGTTCFRVVAGQLAVETSTDGGAHWDVAWSVRGRTYTDLARSYGLTGTPSGGLSSRSVVALAGRSGIAVYVANGRDGVLWRDTAGHWHRLGVPTGGEGVYFATPARLDTDPTPVPLWPFAAVISAATYALAAIRRTRGRPRSRRFGMCLAFDVAVVGAAAAGIALTSDVGMFPPIAYWISLFPVLAGLAALWLLWWLPRPAGHQPVAQRPADLR